MSLQALQRMLPRPAQASLDVPVQCKSACCGRWRLLRNAFATYGLDWMFVYVMCGFLRACKRSLLLSVFTFEPIPSIKTSCELMLSFAYPFCLLFFGWCPILSLNLTVASTGRQSMNKEHNMNSFTFLCASLPPVHSHSAYPAATPVSPRGSGYTEVQLPPPFFQILVTHSVATSHVSVQMTHNPKQEPWLHRWSLWTYHTTRILSYQSVESVSQHTDTCCEQTHRSSRCRRYRHLCEILVLTTIPITHISAAEHLGRSSCLGAGLSQLIASLPIPFQAH